MSNLPEARVVVVASKFAPHAGGTAVVWTQWCHHWPARNLRVIAPRIPEDRQFDLQQAYQIYRCGYPDIPKIRMPWLWIHQASVLVRECLKEKPELIHFSHVFENGFMGPILSRWLGIPYFIHTYGEELTLALRFPWLKSLVSQVLAQASGVTTISRFTENLHKQFAHNRPSLLVHPAVDTIRYRPGLERNLAQKKFNLPEGRLLLTTGRLMERKGHASVIRVLPALIERFGDLHYAIAGVGPYAAELTGLVSDLGLGNRISFLGRVSDEDLPILLNEATLFVHPSQVTASGDVEGFGIVFLEAAACGIPVVGGRSGGIPDAVQEGVTGLLVSSEQELFEALVELLENPLRCQQMGRAGREWACTFRWDRAAELVWGYSLARV